MGLSLIVIASLAAAAGTDDAKQDLDKMQGTWKVIVAERDAAKLPEKVLQAMQVVIKDDSLTIIGDKNAKYPTPAAGTLKLTPTSKPKSFDITTSLTGVESKVAHGIYELTDNTLRMCWTRKGGERPSEFATKPNSNGVLFVLKRDKKE